MADNETVVIIYDFLVWQWWLKWSVLIKFDSLELNNNDPFERRQRNQKKNKTKKMRNNSYA